METIKVNLRNKRKRNRVLISSKQQRQQELVASVYNNIHNFNDYAEINRAINLLRSYKEKIQLIDKVIMRREQIANMVQVQKIQENYQLFDQIRKKWIGNIANKQVPLLNLSQK